MPANDQPESRSLTLKELSDAATPGPWNGSSFRLKIMNRDGPIMSYQVGNKSAPEGMCVSVASERVADHQFVAALVNAYRAGELVEKPSASSETEATPVGMSPANFIQAALNISAERRKGYERREHGDLVNKRCADDLETLCGEYLSRLSERGGQQ